MQVRRRIGMVFQKPTPFPTMSIEDNVAAGLKLNGISVSRAEREALVEKSLRQAALWDEVKDHLKRPGRGFRAGSNNVCASRGAIASSPRYC